MNEKVDFEKEKFNPDVDLNFGTRASNRLYSQLVISELCSVYFAILGLVMQVLKYETAVGSTNKGEDRVKVMVIPKYSMLCTFLLVASIYIRYDLWLKW